MQSLSVFEKVKVINPFNLSCILLSIGKMIFSSGLRNSSLKHVQKYVIRTLVHSEEMIVKNSMMRHISSLNTLISRVHATLHSALSVGWLVGRSVGRLVVWSVGPFLLFLFVLFLLTDFKSIRSF